MRTLLAAASTLSLFGCAQRLDAVDVAILYRDYARRPVRWQEPGETQASRAQLVAPIDEHNRTFAVEQRSDDVALIVASELTSSSTIARTAAHTWRQFLTRALSIPTSHIVAFVDAVTPECDAIRVAASNLANRSFRGNFWIIYVGAGRAHEVGLICGDSGRSAMMGVDMLLSDTDSARGARLLISDAFHATATSTGEERGSGPPESGELEAIVSRRAAGSPVSAVFRSTLEVGARRQTRPYSYRLMSALRGNLSAPREDDGMVTLGEVAAEAGSYTNVQLLGKREGVVVSHARLRIQDGTPFRVEDMTYVAGGLYEGQRVNAFYLDTREVTVGEYRKCVESGDCEMPREDHADQPPSPGRVNGRNDIPYCNWSRSDVDGHPMNCVTHAEADRYCMAQSARLPTELEWRWAARGGSRGRRYPWGRGKRWVAARANGCDRGCKSLPMHLFVPNERRQDGALVYDPLLWTSAMDRGGTAGDDGFQTTAPVGSYVKGRSADGIYDLAGNVAEWTLMIAEDEEQDCNVPGDAEGRIMGGSWADDRGLMRTDVRRHLRRGEHAQFCHLRTPHVGFRCLVEVTPSQ